MLIPFSAHDARRPISRDQCWDMQEVYGVQNPDAVEAGADEGNTECIICMCEPRDTLVLSLEKTQEQ